MVIVIHNEENAIAKVVLQTRRFVDRVVVCDDGSRDLTGAIAEGLGSAAGEHRVMGNQQRRAGAHES